MPTFKLPNVGTDQPLWKTEVIAWAQEIDKHTNAHFLLKSNIIDFQRSEWIICSTVYGS